MNFSAIEESISEEKNKFSNFLSYFFKNARVLIILLALAVITTISISVWRKSSDYQILYNNLSIEDSEFIIDYLNQMKIPYQFSENSKKLLVPKNQIYDLRLHFSEKNLPRSGVGFEILDKEKFGISQFNEQINYQRALEGELARTIERINVVKNARIHIAIPKSSLFLQDKKKPSASVILSLKSGTALNSNQTNAILHLISNSISDLSVDNITIVDEFGKLLNDTSLESNQINDVKLRYSEQIESRYANKIQSILEPLFGVGNVHAQVTAQIDFNSQEKTREKYEPNTNYEDQSIRSHQTSINDKIKSKKDNDENHYSLRNNLPNSNYNKAKKSDTVKNHKPFKGSFINSNSTINHDDTINYELNHTLSHIKMNVGEVKRLSAAVVVNFIQNKTGKAVPLNSKQIKNIKNLVCESIGYSKIRGDSVHVINEPFAAYDNKNTFTKFNNFNQPNIFNTFSILIPWCILALFLLYFLKKYIFSFSKNTFKNKRLDKRNIKKEIVNSNENESANNVKTKVFKNLNTENTDNLVHQICNISNQNPRVIASIIRQWMSDKK
ncbi:flagellar basal body M-ring protein FliF [Buchnera aphidicola (Aphis craccivora)]|uniref:Flagellar M-ring protein n=1 Tax=Buchnera aphidicola (Aphis craccivora) TaxID=466616 RepID=A0A4D6XKZ3_9GAMM|nr:flagellar basal-body MS-ring/collar protein FliF [Buchnera aphidicola]QCI16339.1 flagellar basal body M-ring protein FliF [Buchnera aphidicola (Aphis craccivora)]QLL40482.1 flagellar basal body M-ring protein FliF [Buchnera aphidicola (Aphis craccivore)]WAI17853.1 MAG: flagellar basal-body MS-ring/collar protein FliF [Buchnera aphidicola (Aphis craccivora)]